MNEYDKQAEDFLTKFKVKIDKTYIGDRKGFPNKPNDEMIHQEWVVRIFHEDNPTEYMQFPFYGSYHDYLEYQEEERRYNNNLPSKKPKRELRDYDILACLSSEMYCPETIEDFIDEYGYEIKRGGDLKRVMNIYDGLKKQSDDLHRIFNEEELEALSEIQ